MDDIFSDRNVLILEPHSVNKFREGGGGVNCYSSHLYKHHWQCKTVETFPSFPRKIYNVEILLNILWTTSSKKKKWINKLKKNTTDDQIWELPLAILNYAGSESDIYVTRISVIFIYALGFLFLPKNLAPAAGNVSNFIFLPKLEWSLIYCHWKNKLVHSL